MTCRSRYKSLYEMTPENVPKQYIQSVFLLAANYIISLVSPIGPPGYNSTMIRLDPIVVLMVQ